MQNITFDVTSGALEVGTLRADSGVCGFQYSDNFGSRFPISAFSTSAFLLCLPKFFGDLRFVPTHGKRERT